MKNSEDFLLTEIQSIKSLKDYVRLIYNNLLIFTIIIAISLFVTILYALKTTDVYTSKTIIKINKSGGDILQSPILSEFEEYADDRFIANEIEVIKSYKLRKRIAEALTDTFKQTCNSQKRNICESLFYNIINRDFLKDHSEVQILPLKEIASRLPDYTTIEQQAGVDIIVIESESPSSYESTLISNVYANEYRNLNLELNRNQLTYVKNFLKNQKEEKQKELKEFEDTLKQFQEKGGIIALDEQATALIGELTNFEAQKNAAQIELMASDEVLAQYKSELIKQDPALADYLESLSSEAYITALQKQLAEVQLNKDLALSNINSDMDLSDRVKEFDRKIFELKAKLNDKIKVIKAGIFASSPTQVKELSQKIIEEEVKNRSLRISVEGLQSVVNSYERRFNKLPKTSLELAQFQRGRESLEKLYILVEEKFQEALINEQSQPGNVLIIDEAERPSMPSKPNRMIIVIVGFLAGSFVSFMILLIKDYFNTYVTSPEDIEKAKIHVLGWIPHIKMRFNNGNSKYTLLDTNSEQFEAFRTLRTRIQFSRSNPNALKIILVTSSAPGEGKSFVAVNLAKSFAQINKKTIIIDCDLRKPRIHSVFESNKTPGLVDYLINKVSLDSIINISVEPDLFYITAGTITPNPVELLISEEMKRFMLFLKTNFGYIILDSPPLFAVTDSEILSKMADGTILVISTNNTQIEMMHKAVSVIKSEKSFFIGTVLNNFIYKRGYAPYYKYYGNYSDSYKT